MNPTVTQNTNTTHRVEVRTQILIGMEEELKLKLVEAKQKIQEQPLVDDFEMSRILELDAELFALMTERYAIERAESTRLYFVTYHGVLEETLRQMTERLSGTRQSSTSQMSNEIHIRRHFALLERINRLRDILTYNQDA